MKLYETFRPEQMYVFLLGSDKIMKMFLTDMLQNTEKDSATIKDAQNIAILNRNFRKRVFRCLNVSLKNAENAFFCGKG